MPEGPVDLDWTQAASDEGEDNAGSGHRHGRLLFG